MQQANKSLELPTTGVQPHLMIREEFSTRPGQRPAPPRQALKFLDFQPKLTHPRPRSGPCRPANQAPCDTDTIRPVAFPRGAPGSVSPTVFPASGLVGLGGREPVAEGDSECVDGGLPSHG